MNLDLNDLASLVADELPDALFTTVSGSHLYGFSSIDSDIDVRGAFLAPLDHVVGLIPVNETVERKYDRHGVEVELVAHEARKYLHLMCKHNGYILEQVFSPLVVTGQTFLERLRPLAKRCVTRGCYHHYRGFLQSQRKLLEREPAWRAKTLLYSYRVLLTGIHLLRTGEVESHLPTLNQEFRLSYIDELIERKRTAERGTVTGLDAQHHLTELNRLESELDRAHAESRLPEAAPREELHQFLINLRREG